MKHTKNILGTMLLMATVVATSSCVDDTKLLFSVEKPATIVGMEYLNDYDALKNYVNSSANPNFKLGIALTANDYIAGGQVTQLANSNFVEMTAGNAMKYASCVADDGTMNFDAVENFVSAAKAGGLTIYGHTLAWHAQQNNKYLNSLLKDKEMDVDPDAKVETVDYVVDYSTAGYSFWNEVNAEVKGTTTIGKNDAEGCLEIKSSIAATQNHFIQYFTADNLPTVKDKEYKLKMMVKGSAEGTLAVGVGDWGGRAEGGKFNFDTEWKEFEFSFKAVCNGGHVMTQSGLFAGTIQIKYVKITHSEAPTVEIYTDVLENGEMVVGKPMNNFIVREHGKADVPGNILAGQGPDGKNCISITSISGAENTHDTQFFITSDKVWEAGERYRISFWYKATAEAKCETQCHVTPGAYFHWAMLPQNPTFTTEWQHYEVTSTIPAEAADKGMKTIAFNLNVDKENAHTYYLADIHWETIKKGNSIPLTSAEKKEVLTKAMNTWIAGMMKATAGYVTAWDVVNEAIAGGGDDGEGFYPLQSTKNVSAEDAKNNFYWQDYLGNEDYTRIVVAAARKYYAENGGTDPLKLFVNDYNLESDWDDNKKVKSLVHWIEKWEADGVTKIDGIGSQMHVSCYANADTQKSKEEHVVKMFEILANSGKLVKISELDMGYIDEDGNSVKTEKMTEAQHKAMSEYYKFIVKKYFEIIPAAQQYGITQWCITDSPTDSGWRGGEPVGLWDAHYSRKHTYAGFADGLAGK